MEQFKMVAECPESTVVADYEARPRNDSRYQSEAEMERELIEQLQGQAYDYLPITSEKEMVANLRHQLERLNDYRFTEREWEAFFKSKISSQNLGIAEKTAIIQEDHVQVLTREDGTTKNIYLIDKRDIHRNSLQVINQYVPEGGQRDNRYDVTILVNGLPLVHVELKRRGVDIKEAFNQIRRYNRESFWAGSGLFEYVQIFVISNGTSTKYYSNTTRSAHIRDMEKGAKGPGQQTSNSFEFTSYWARTDNRIIPDLVDFTATFLTKHTLLNVLTRYCVFTSERLLLVMRPYQIAATEAIIQRIRLASNYKWYGSVDGGGYIWHTTGSGKTLTSFKAARLASRMEEIDKVIFVVDRKDLDYQTMKEYDRFEKGAANSNTNTAVLKRQLEDPEARIIITTIQKLSVFIKKNPAHPVYAQRVVMIFDECHRSQFGEMHAAIVKRFKKYHIFGFTGTPIFASNSTSGGRMDFRTTDQTFGKRLHIYTIVDAIADGNVLPFRIDYVRTMREGDTIADEKVFGIDREKALLGPERVRMVTRYILDHFAQKTKRGGRSYEFNRLTNISEVASGGGGGEIKRRARLVGFNSIFAVASIEAAKLYYSEFKRQQADLPENQRLTVATIFSFGVNEDNDENSGILDDENSESTASLDQSSRDFLEAAISDYNIKFKTNYDTSSERFQNYYKDVSLRMKNREIDILIVVNMFLTGFDATTLNTLWVDKNLREHGLIQAYSRTNRILNSVKTFGNIVCFRNLEQATNEAIARFGDKEAGGLVLLKTFEEYYEGYEDDKGKHQTGYKELIEALTTKFPVGKPIVGEQQEKAFIKLYGSILRATNILTTFDQFTGMEILTPRDQQDYHSMYIDLYDKFRKTEGGDMVNVNDDIVFEMELVKQVEINIDYILYLVAKLHGDHTTDMEIKLSIQKAVASSPDLRNKKDLIEQFVNQFTVGGDVADEWQEYVNEQRKEQLDTIIREEKLRPEATYAFMNQSFRDGSVQEGGTGIAKILPPMSIFDKGREAKKRTVIDRLKAFFERFCDICSGIIE